MNKYFVSLFFLFQLFSTTQFAQSFYKIDSIILAEISNKNIFGGVALIAKDNKIIYHKAYGSISNDSLRLMKAHSIFRIASQTKAIISVATLQLVEKGQIQLDDPIDNYFPSFRDQQVFQIIEGKRQLVKKLRSITIRDLLTHQSGISSADEYPTFKEEFKKYQLTNTGFKNYVNLAQEVEQIARMPLMHQPGARFSYGLSTNVLGALIEQVAKMPLDQYLSQFIFKPLKMKDTYFYLPKSKQHRLVKVAFKSKNQLIEAADTAFFTDFPLLSDKTYFSAIGGLVSTTRDYFKFLSSITPNVNMDKQVRLLTNSTIDSLLTNQLGDKTFIFGGFPSKNNFGLGVGLTTESGQSINRASVGSFFWGGAFNTAYMVDPKRRLITLFYFQRTPFVLPSLLSKLEKTTIEILDNH